MRVASTLLWDLAARGIAVEADGNLIRCRPRTAVTAELRARMLAAKPALLAELRRGHAGGAAPSPDNPPASFLATAVLHPEDFGIRTASDLCGADRDDRTTRPCRACSGARWWRLRPAGDWVCARCHPPQPLPEQIEVREGGGHG